MQMPFVAFHMTDTEIEQAAKWLGRSMLMIYNVGSISAIILLLELSKEVIIFLYYSVCYKVCLMIG